MDSNCGPLSSEATALPTEPQQLPGHSIKLSVCATVTEHQRQSTLSAVGSGCGSFGEQSVLTPEVHGLNHVIGKKIIQCLLLTVL